MFSWFRALFKKKQEEIYKEYEVEFIKAGTGSSYLYIWATNEVEAVHTFYNHHDGNVYDVVQVKINSEINKVN